MEAATSNAGEMIDSLTLAMNRARQAKIGVQGRVLGQERAGALAPPDDSVLLEPLQRLPDGLAAHAELIRKGHLGRQPLAHLAAGKPSKNDVADLQVLRERMVVAGPGDLACLPSLHPFSQHLLVGLRAPV